MTSDNLDELTQDILQRVEKPAVDPVRGDNAAAESIMVFDKRSRWFCFGYRSLVWTCLDPSGKLFLRFNAHTVEVEGTRLQLLQEQLRRKEASVLKAAAPRYAGWSGGQGSEITSVIVRGDDENPEKAWVDDKGLTDKSGALPPQQPGKPA